MTEEKSDDDRNQIVLNFTDKELRDIAIFSRMISIRNKKKMPNHIAAKIIFNQGLRHHRHKIDDFKKKGEEYQKKKISHS